METDDDSPDRETLPQSNSQSCEGDLSALVILPTPVAGQPTEQPLSQPLSGNTQESLRAEEHVSSGSEEELTKKIEEHVEDKKIEEHVEDKDDDFGDFGQFASTEPEMFPVADEGETRYSAFNSKVANKDVKNGINVIWPVLKELESKADHDGLFKDKTRIVPSITDRDWVNLYNILVNDTVFSENGGSRLAWRRSVIRQRFLESLNISENVNPPPLSAGLTSPAVLQEKASNMELAQKELPKVPVNQNTVLNDREKDLIEAKKLCDFAEDELRKKDLQELQLFMQNMQTYQQKMYEQSNYWLDAKEQLIMDAETHNKVIASLVQYARDQQQAPKIAKAGTNTGRKK